MDAPRAYDQVVAWLRGLPADCELAWGDDALVPASGLAYGFVDAYVPLAARAFDLQWLWSIFPTPSDRERERVGVEEYLARPDEGPGEGAGEVQLLLEPEALAAFGVVSARSLTVAELAEALGEEIEIRVEVETDDGWEEVSHQGQPLDLELPYDATLEVAFDPEGRGVWAWLYPDAGGAQAVAPEHLDLTGLSRGQAEDARSEQGLVVRSRRVWTLATLDAALQGWALAHAGRADLRFACRDGIDPSPLAARLSRQAADD